MSDVVARIKRFNKGRDPHLLARKFAEMRASMFRFYRGTCHLYYEDWPKRGPLSACVAGWVSGDLHPENFGSFRGRDGGVYFDVNDFDEANLGPVLWDAVRCLTGILIGTEEQGILDEDCRELCRRYLYAYRDCLSRGTAYAVTADASTGMVRELLEGVA
ncbi:MAG TPA: DUF2252 family protein, partial [Candidatus Eremiobacteraceae bacterium]|nr:DUF2252 family protein [Candidatus Eremiobacteraceae bacterium]